jgi:hypothetical protein
MEPGVSLCSARASLPAYCSTGVDECWKAACKAVQADEDVVGATRVHELERRVRELERLLGRKTMEVEILKEALDVAQVKQTELCSCAIMERSQGRRVASARQLIAGEFARDLRFRTADRLRDRASRMA